MFQLQIYKAFRPLLKAKITVVPPQAGEGVSSSRYRREELTGEAAIRRLMQSISRARVARTAFIGEGLLTLLLLSTDGEKFYAFSLNFIKSTVY